MDEVPGPSGRFGWLEHIWLASLFFVFFPLIFSPGTDAVDWIATGALVAAFLVLYAWAYVATERGALVPMGLIALLGIAGAYVNSGTTVFLIFVSAFAAHLLPPHRALWVIGGLAAIVVVIGLTLPAPMPFGLAAVTPAFLFIIVIGLAEISSAQRERADARLRLAQEEIERLATVAERERIARDLHDLLGHTLSVIVLKAELASRLMDRDPERAATEVSEVERISRTALAEVRAAVQGYRGQSLARELEGARRTLAAAGIAVETEIDAVELPETRDEVLALAVREAITNIIRHSSARIVRIELHSRSEGVRLTVADDGRGGDAPEGSGLRGMRERLAAFGGSLERDTSAGTRLSIVLPPSA
jgi:two-component system, NarL family, sensor histidine kinase DesK